MQERIKTTAIILFFLKQLSIFGSCGYDGRTLTELLFEKKAGTIFTCKILTMTVPVPDGNLLMVSSCGGGIDGTATAVITTVYFGIVDTSVVTLKTGSSLTVGKSYVIYSLGNGRVFGCGGNCDQRMHEIVGSPEDLSELKILRQFSDAYKHKKSGKYTFLSSTNIVLAAGEFNKGVPVKTWKHYFPDGALKTENDVASKRIRTYASNGLLLVDNIEYKDSTVSLAYSNVTNGQLNYRSVTFPNDRGFIMKNCEYYPNGNLKQCESTIYVGEKGGGISTDGKTGSYIEGFENGHIKVLGAMNKTKRTGVWKWFNEDGSFNAEFDYKDGTGAQ